MYTLYDSLLCLRRIKEGVRKAVGVCVGVCRRSLALARHTLLLAQFLFIFYCEQNAHFLYFSRSFFLSY